MRLAATMRKFADLPWRLWLRQSATIIRLDLRKNFLSRRGFWIYLLAYAPTVIIALHAVVNRRPSMREDTMVLAAIFQFYYLRLAIFFGCMGIFTRLIRGEMIERSLHYYLLAPVRREVLVLAKFVAGAITAVFFFGSAVALSFFFMYGAYGKGGSDYIWHGPGGHQFAMYLLITVLACFGYGALFVAFSMTVKNPIVPGIIVMGWEGINPILPSLMQKLSVIFYLRNLEPIQIPARGIFALLSVVTEPVAPWLAVTGVIAVTAVVLVYACVRVRRLEISYSTD